jgi:hypothetical protein
MSESPLDLKDPAVMLATLRLAYRAVLDRAISDSVDPHPQRLSYEQKRELGRRLAQYWDMDPKPTAEERVWHVPQEDDPFIAILRAARNGADEMLRVFGDEKDDGT